AAKLLKIDQPKVSAILNTKISGFSVERLLGFLTRLGHNVRISIEDRETDHAGVSVEMR
ncbi:MAG: XRE family transcriptional regulator, partial [Alphaproteobacteria bacterium]|nr:XRE family transcriptional regulator [Alphaproteobacteria bacterium]